MAFQPTHLTRAQLEERRRLGAQLLHQRKLSQAEIARRLGVSRSAVSQWASQLSQGGLRQLRGRTSQGRPPKLAQEQKRVLLRLLKRGARDAGFPTERWTLQRIQTLIQREFRVPYHPTWLIPKLRWTLSIARSQICEFRLISANRMDYWTSALTPRHAKNPFSVEK